LEEVHVLAQDIVKTKRCWKCGEPKPITDFYKNRSKFDGLGDYCKPCDHARLKRYAKTPKGRAKVLARVRKYQATARGKTTIAVYLQSPRGRALKCAQVRRSAARYPEKIKARNDLNHAIQRGEIPKARTLKCAGCGKQAREYHHHLGYAAEHRLHVIPVCKRCHELKERQEGVGRSS
jgi:hypothetical protein